jgi:oligopeptide transport system ATP-binding protein
MTDTQKDIRLSVEGLSVQFRTPDGLVTAVNDLSYHVAGGEVLGIVGESGSGKSVTQLAMMGLLPTPPAVISAGRAMLHGKDMLRMPANELRKKRGAEIAMIFQDPMTSLNPFLRISTQLTEVLATHTDMTAEERKSRAIEVLSLVGIPDAAARIDAYPHQFSGGMRQRVMIAMALLCNPSVLIADEPTTALDVTIQAQILDRLKDLRSEFGTAIVLITHDLGVVAGTADRVVVMYGGRVMEEARTVDLFANPSHPYTVGLLRSLPRLDSDGGDLVPIDGQPPDPARMPPGCPFAPRCPFVEDRCRAAVPELRTVGPDHRTRCIREDLPAFTPAQGGGEA